MALRKVYQATREVILDTYVLVNGQRTLIQFRGGQLKDMNERIPGRFVTDDPDVIEAMDSAGGNGVDWKCIQVDQVPDPPKPKSAEKKPVQQKQQQKQQQKPVDETAGEATQEEQPEDSGEGENEAPKQQVPGVKNVQDARNWLITNLPGVSLANTANARTVKKVAAENNVEFPDLD